LHALGKYLSLLLLVLCFGAVKAQSVKNFAFIGLHKGIEDIAEAHTSWVLGADGFHEISSQLWFEGQLVSEARAPITSPKRQSIYFDTSELWVAPALKDFIAQHQKLPAGNWLQKAVLRNGPDSLNFEEAFDLSPTAFKENPLSPSLLRIDENGFSMRLAARDEGDMMHVYLNGVLATDSIITVTYDNRIAISQYSYGHLCDSLETGAFEFARSYFVNEAVFKDFVTEKARMEAEKLSVVPFSKRALLQPSIGFITEVNLSSIDTLYGLLPANYYRLGFTPRLTVVGVPLQSTIYYTSESGFGYNMNSVNLQLDREALEESLMEKAKTQRRRYRDEMLELNYQERLQEEQVALQEQMLQKCASEQNRVQTLLARQLDSLEQGMHDSLSAQSDALYSRQQHKIDSLQQLADEKAARFEAMRDSIGQLYANAESGYYEVIEKKAAVNRKIAQLKSLKNAGFSNKELLDSAEFISKAEKVLLSIDNLQVGRHLLQPDVADFSAVPVDGVSFDYSHNYLGVGVSLARFSPQNLLFTQTLATDNDYVLKRVALAYGLKGVHELSANVYDAVSRGPNEMGNGFVNLDYNNALWEPLTTRLFLSLSEHHLEGSPLSQRLEEPFITGGNYRLVSETKARLWKDYVNLNYFYAETGQNYSVVTSPFLRNNLRQQQLSLNLKPHSSLNFDVYRKTEWSLNSESADYRMSGYGFTGSYLSPFGLQIQASYLPFNYEVDVVNYNRLARTSSDVLTLSAFQVMPKHMLGFHVTQMQYAYNESSREGLYRNYSFIWQGNFVRDLSISSNIGLNDWWQADERQYSFSINGNASYSLSQTLSINSGYSRQVNLFTGLNQTRSFARLQINFKGISFSIEGGYLEVPARFDASLLQRGFYFNLGGRNN